MKPSMTGRLLKLTHDRLFSACRVGSVTASHGTMDFPGTEWVLAVLDSGSGAVPGGMLGEAQRGRGRYRLELTRPESVAALRDRIAKLAPSLLLVDADWLDRVDADDFARLRREHGGLHWLLAGAGAAELQIDRIIQSQASGYIEWDLDAATFSRALDTVLRGEHWFPRAVMQQLYVSLLEASHAEAVNLDGAASALSPRESQALILVREGLTNKQIAVRLGVSINTVKKHLSHAFEKAGLHRRRQLQD